MNSRTLVSLVAFASLQFTADSSASIIDFNDVWPWQIVANDQGHCDNGGFRFTPTQGNENGFIVAGAYQPEGNPQGNQAYANNGTPNLLCGNWVNLRLETTNGAPFDLASLEIGGTSIPEEVGAWMWAGEVVIVGHRADGGPDYTFTFYEVEFSLVPVSLGWTGLSSVEFLPTFDKENGTGPNSHEFTIDTLDLTAWWSPPTGDLNADGIVDGMDLAILLGAWGETSPEIDLDRSGSVDGADLAILLGAWS